MSDEEIKEEKISEFVSVQLLDRKNTFCPSMVHIPTGTLFKFWAAVEGLEEGAWNAMVAYAQRVVKLHMVNWATDDPDFLFPCGNFVERYMDPVGTGEKTVEEVSAELMAKIMIKSWENPDG